MAKIYYSGSIFGASEEDQKLPTQIVEFLLAKGHDVLSKHVAYPSNYTNAADGKMKLPKAISDMEKIPVGDALYRAIYKFDTDCVDAADYFIALVNAPAHGVGMEIERALLKPERGLAETRILCLAHDKNKEKISGMIRGVDRNVYPNFEILFYSGFDDIKAKLDSFILP